MVRILAGGSTTVTLHLGRHAEIAAELLAEGTPSSVSETFWADSESPS